MAINNETTKRFYSLKLPGFVDIAELNDDELNEITFTGEQMAEIDIYLSNFSTNGWGFWRNQNEEHPPIFDPAAKYLVFRIGYWPHFIKLSNYRKPPYVSID